MFKMSCANKTHTFNAKSRTFNVSLNSKWGQTYEEEEEKFNLSHNDSKGFSTTIFFSTLCKEDLCEEGRLTNLLQQE